MSSEHTIPSDNFTHELVAGGVKAVKSSARRSDAMYFIDPRKLKILTDYNVRIRTPDYLAYVRELADDMKANGFRIDCPITVFVAREGDEDVLYTQAGHTRREAAILAMEEGAEFTEVPFIIKPKSTDAVDMNVDLIRSNNGRHLTALEKALVVKRLENMGLTEADIARRVGITAGYVNGLLILAGAPQAIKEWVIAEKVAAATAISMMRKHGGKAVEILRKTIEASDGKVRPAALPGAKRESFIKRSAPRFFEAATLVTKDPGYQSLSDKTRQLIEEILTSVERATAETAQ